MNAGPDSLISRQKGTDGSPALGFCVIPSIVFQLSAPTILSAVLLVSLCPAAESGKLEATPVANKTFKVQARATSNSTFLSLIIHMFYCSYKRKRICTTCCCSQNWILRQSFEYCKISLLMESVPIFFMNI